MYRTGAVLKTPQYRKCAIEYMYIGKNVIYDCSPVVLFGSYCWPWPQNIGFRRNKSTFAIFFP